MPTIQDNLSCWSNYDWKEAGDEWSSSWGNSYYLWLCTVYPRIQSFLPAKTVLEIAPGYGRMTQFIAPMCQHLILVDLVERCIDACKQRFSAYNHIDYHVNDGLSLEMVADRSIDFVFSWDSLVHVECNVMESYVKQLATKLKPGGMGFLHHSNMAVYQNTRTGELIRENNHSRGISMSAGLFREYCQSAGLACLTQEVIAWGGDTLSDCLSVFTLPDSPDSIPLKFVENQKFMMEASFSQQFAYLYGRGRTTPPSNTQQYGTLEKSGNRRFFSLIKRIFDAKK